MKIKCFIAAFVSLTFLLSACQPASPELAAWEPAAEEPAAEEPAGMELDTNSGGISPVAYVPSGSRMVIKDAEMELLVRDSDAAIIHVTQMAADYGGYIVSSNTWYEDDYKYATLRLSIPADTFEAVLNQLRIFGISVLKETASGQDVTADYVDLESRLTNLEATAARVRQFLEEAETVEEALDVNEELAELEAEIEEVKGWLRYLDGRTAYSTVTVSLTPERPTPTPTPTPTPAPGWNAGDTFESSSESLVKLTQGTIDVLIWFVVVLGPLLVVVGCIIWIFRRIRRRKENTSQIPDCRQISND